MERSATQNIVAIKCTERISYKSDLFILRKVVSPPCFFLCISLFCIYFFIVLKIYWPTTPSQTEVSQHNMTIMGSRGWIHIFGDPLHF